MHLQFLMVNGFASGTKFTMSSGNQTFNADYVVMTLKSGGNVGIGKPQLENLILLVIKHYI